MANKNETYSWFFRPEILTPIVSVCSVHLFRGLLLDFLQSNDEFFDGVGWFHYWMLIFIKPLGWWGLKKALQVRGGLLDHLFVVMIKYSFCHSLRNSWRTEFKLEVKLYRVLTGKATISLIALFVVIFVKCKLNITVYEFESK